MFTKVFLLSMLAALQTKAAYIPPLAVQPVIPSDVVANATLSDTLGTVVVAAAGTADGAMSISGTFTGTIAVYGVPYGAAAPQQLSLLSPSGGGWQLQTANTVGTWKWRGAGGFQYVRAQFTSLTSGSASVYLVPTTATSAPVVSQPTASNLNATVVQGGTPWVENITQIAGSALSASNALPARITNGTSYVDPTLIRALTSADVVSAAQSGTWTVAVSNQLTGYATSALQTSGNSTLTAISGQLPSTLGAKTSAGSLSVALATDSPALPVSGTVSVSNFPATQAVSGTVTANQGSAGAAAWKVDGSAVTQPVSGTVAVSNFPATQTIAGTVNQGTGGASAWKVDGSAVTQPVSAASLPLPTGAATESTLAAMSAKVPALGQSTKSGSQPVTLASDQGPIAVTSNTSDAVTSGTITIVNSVPAGTATANSAVQSSTLNGAASVAVQVTGTYTGALSLQYSVDGTNWITAGGTPFYNVNTGSFLNLITSALQGVFQVQTGGMNMVRVTALSAVTGTATVTLRASRGSTNVALASSIPAGSAVIGGVSQSGTWTTTPALPAALTPTSAAVTLGTTAVRLVASGTAPTTRRYLVFVADTNNTGSCYYGSSTVTTATGIYMYPGAVTRFDNDVNDYYGICDTAAQTARVLEDK